MVVYLKKTKTREGRIYLSITEGFRKDGKVRTRTVESLGYLDELEKKYDDPIAHFEAQAKAATEEKKCAETPVLIEAHMSEKSIRVLRKVPLIWVLWFCLATIMLLVLGRFGILVRYTHT